MQKREHGHEHEQEHEGTARTRAVARAKDTGLGRTEARFLRIARAASLLVTFLLLFPPSPRSALAIEITLVRKELRVQFRLF